MNVPILSTQKTQESIKSKSLKTKYVAKRTEIDESLFGISFVIQASEPTNPNKMKRSSRKLPKWSRQKIIIILSLES